MPTSLRRRTPRPAALLSYAEHTQGQTLAHVRSLGVHRASDLLDLPPTTCRNLELTQTLRGEEAPTLLSLLDTCRTGMGSRALRDWLTHPLRERRLAHPAPRRDRGRCTRTARPRCATRCDRSATSSASPRRIALRQVRPRELAGLRATLQSLPALRQAVPEGADAAARHAARGDGAAGRDASGCCVATIAAEPAALVRDGGVIAAGFDAELDELRGSAELRASSCSTSKPRERARTGIANLRVAVQQGARLLHRGHARPGRQGARTTTGAARR